MTIGNQIKTARVKNKLTQDELGELIGFTKQEVSRWEKDKHIPIFCTLSKIQKILNFKIEMP